jgi:PleD family two-component response regulator
LAGQGIGVAHSEQAMSMDEIYRIADMALYRAKQSGRNRVELATHKRIEATKSDG